MTLFEVISILKKIALTHPNVQTATDGSVYDVMNTNPSVKYDVVHFQQTNHQSDEETDTYGFNIFYISRLEDSLEDNRLQIQSIGKEILDNILRTFCENWSIDFPIITYTPFTQRFNDLCAGCYCNVRIDIPKELICADDFIDEVIPSEKNIRLQDVSVTITENGLRVITPSAGFDGIGQITIETDVPGAGRMEYKEVDYDTNGDYTIRPSAGYDGISEVAVTVNVPTTEDRYEEGFIDGIEYQKSLLVPTAFTENGGYASENGYSIVYVNVPQTGSSNEDLIANLQGDYYVIPYGTNKLRSYAFFSTCFSSITIPNTVITIGDEAFANNTCLTSITIPDSVTRIDSYAFSYDTSLQSVEIGTGLTYLGFSVFNACPAITAMTFYGLTPPTLQSTSGYAASLGSTDYTFPIYVPCQSLEAYKTAFGPSYAPRIQCVGQEMITAITLNVDSEITDNGTATTTYSPSTAYTNIYYTSSNPSIATIDPNTGVITVVANGTVTICTTDRISGLQDCKTVTAIKSAPLYQTLHFVYSTTTSNEQVIFYDTTNLPESTNFEVAASDSTRAWVNNLVSMEIEGVEVPVTSAYTFETPGKHIVKYNSPVGTVPDYLFSLYKNPHSRSSAQNEKLIEAHIGEGFGVLLNNAFDGDTNLTAVTLPSTMKVLGNSPFRKTGIKTIVIPDSVTANTSITDYRPYANRYVNNSEDINWFSGCTRLSSVTIGTGVSVVPAGCFKGCTSLSSVTVPNNVTKLCDEAFSNNPSLTGVTIPTNLTGIGSSTFLTTSLVSSISFPDTLKTIGTMAYSNALNVRNVTFGTGITSIASNAFYFTNITAMTFNRTTPPVLGNESALGPNSREGFKIYVPSSAVNAYKSAWPYYENNITAIIP